MSAGESEELHFRLKQVEAENERLRACIERASEEVHSEASQGRLHAILESATDYAILTTDERGFVTSWNEGARSLLGWHPEEILGRDGRAIFTPEDRAGGVPEQEMEQASKKGRAEDERWHLRKDGSRFWASGLLMALRQGPPGYLKILRDRTHAKSKEGVLRKIEALHKAILDAALDCIVSIGADSTIVEWNPAAERTFGYSASEAIGKDIAQLIIPPEFRDRHYKGMAHYLATGEGPVLGRRVELEALRADGSRFPVELTITPTSVEGAAHFTAYLRDISERRWAEEQLRASEARLVALIDSLPVGICFADREGNTLLTNPALRRFLPEGVIPSRLPDPEERWIAHDTQGRRLSRDQFPAARALRGETVQGIEFLHRAVDGQETWTRLSGIPLRDASGQVTGAIAVIVDIDREKRAHETLQRLNENLEQEVAARTAERDRIWFLSHDLLAVAGFEGQLKAINPAWTRVLGFDQATLLSTPFTDLIHPDDLPAAGAAVMAMKRGQTTERFEDRLRTVDGSYRTISWTAVPEADVFYAVGRDVTEWRHTEDQLRQAQKMEAVGQLTGGVAHDFNNLLTIIRSSIEFLRRPNLSEDRRRRYMEAISDTVDRASKLTSQLLAFARRQALKPEVFDISERIRSISDMLRTVMGSRIQTVTEIKCEPCLVEADVVQFETALVNMAVNARDAMDGEGRLTLRLSQVSQIPALRAHPPKPGQFVAVSLTDTGCGIRRDQLDHIFEPFFTTKEVGKGTGLGLSQVFGFAKQSGGEVAVESNVGRGTTFTLYLPHVDRPTANEARTGVDQTEFADGQGRRVLVVEDNIEVGQFSTELLQDLGYHTTWAANADEALRTLEEECARFDVVFSDVVMPGMNGVDLGREIERRYPGLPVVLTSGYSHVLAQEGPHGFELLQKPYAAEEVSRVLRRVVEGTHKHQD